MAFFKPQSSPAFLEAVLLLAFMISIVAMSIDMMLPALQVIGQDLAIANPNEAQTIVTALFIGFSVGQFFVGPLSDRFGMRPVIIGGYLVFLAGCALSYLAEDMTVMLIGRALQGLGAAAPRIITQSLVRDLYEGRQMARVLSIIMSVFILVPALAPLGGQTLLALADWRAIFLVLFAQAFIACLWFSSRQPETLALEKRRALSLRLLGSGVLEMLSHRAVMGYTLTLGCLFAAFMAYLSSAQQIYQVVFAAGDLFALYFALAALSIGAASILNSFLVVRLGMRFLSGLALIGLVALSALFALYLLLAKGPPPLALFLGWVLPSFFCVGLLFGNLSALALNPLGHMVGLGAALTGSISSLVAIPIGWWIGQHFDGSVKPLVFGFFILSVLALALMQWAGRQPRQKAAAA